MRIKQVRIFNVKWLNEHLQMRWWMNETLGIDTLQYLYLHQILWVQESGSGETFGCTPIKWIRQTIIARAKCKPSKWMRQINIDFRITWRKINPVIWLSLTNNASNNLYIHQKTTSLEKDTKRSINMHLSMYLYKSNSRWWRCDAWTTRVAQRRHSTWHPHLSTRTHFTFGIHHS